MTTGLRFFYRHLYVTGLENIPPKGPVIIIANHASSLMDAAVLGILLKRQLFFFARGDVFVNKPVRAMLSWLHMMPVHQHTAGRHTLAANTNSFSEAQRILANGGIIVFFPESTSHTDRQLWPFRKGVFRLAFQTAQASQFSFEITIVPVGITYDHPVHARTTAQVHVGEPLFLSHYTASYLDNTSATLLRISKDAYERAHKKVLHINNKEHLAIAEQCLELNRNNTGTHPTWKIASDKRLQEERAICQFINNATASEINQVKQEQAVYFDALNKHGLDDTTFGRAASCSFAKPLLVWLGAPLFAAGALLNGLPILLARLVADKKVKRIDFYTWVFVAFYTVLYLGWLITVGIVTAMLLGWQFIFAVIPAIILTGLFSYYYIDWYNSYRNYRQLKRLSHEQRTRLNTLRDNVQKLTGQLATMS